MFLRIDSGENFEKIKFKSIIIRGTSMENILVISTIELKLGGSEAQELVNILSGSGRRVNLFQAMHSSLELYRSLRDSPYELVWIASHSGPEGFKLEEEILKPSELGLFLQEAKTSDLVLNSCFSVTHVQQIQQSSNTNILATIDPEGIEDEDAWTSAIYLARSIARTGDLYKSYSEMLVGNSSQYRWFPAPRPKVQNVPESQLENRLRRMEDSVGDLVRTLQGDQFSRQKGLLQAAEDFQVEMKSYIRSDQDWKRQTEERIKRIESTKDGDSSGKILVITWRTAVYLALLFIACSAILIYLTTTLQG